jgi:hypothetical protein
VGYGALVCAFSNEQPNCHDTFAVVFDGTSNIQAQEVVLDFCPTCDVQVFRLGFGSCFGSVRVSLRAVRQRAGGLPMHLCGGV